MHQLSHGLYTDTLFIGEENEYLVRGICPGIGEEIQLVSATARLHSQ